MKRVAKKTFLKLLCYALMLLPYAALADFVVEEERETPSQYAQQGLQTLNITARAINVFLGLLFLTSVIGMFVALVKFIIAGGSEEMLNSARKISLASLMGIIFSLIGYILINTIKLFFV